MHIYISYYIKYIYNIYNYYNNICIDFYFTINYKSINISDKLEKNINN